MHYGPHSCGKPGFLSHLLDLVLVSASLCHSSPKFPFLTMQEKFPVPFRMFLGPYLQAFYEILQVFCLKRAIFLFSSVAIFLSLSRDRDRDRDRDTDTDTDTDTVRTRQFLVY